jgi:hypothetical protein
MLKSQPNPTVNELENKEKRQTALLPLLLSFSRFSPLFLLSFNSVLLCLPSTVADHILIQKGNQLPLTN